MRYLFAISRILMVFLLFFISNSAAQNNNPTSNCPSSSCGNIKDIRYPFRLKSDPRSCGYHNSDFELDCWNDQTILNVSSRIYYVEEINYTNFSIRVVDSGINRKNLSSCPLYSTHYLYDWLETTVFWDIELYNVPVAFIHCLAPVNSSKYVKSPICGNRSSTFFPNSSEIHSYVTVVGEIRELYLEESCILVSVDWISNKWVMRDNSSLASIYDGLAYGFDILWSRIVCRECSGGIIDCKLKGTTFICVKSCRANIFIEAGSFKCTLTEIWKSDILYYGRISIGALLGLRFVCGFPFLVGLVICKWRRRHLSMDETIEEFLQGQNNLTPIKYTYSELKKMTNNFNQRLGEGAFGTVYKGKLRSGPFVAVKMMGQSMASEQEFISEVGTIRRIHHVNVVQLIGFCVEGSKCALVYEFLPNGSLDRYIFSQQSLDALALRYEKMFEIALGVARGIDYLHRGCDMQILHFDIKPHNILLDDNFNPKISDFGLAKLYPTGGSIVNITAARGTMGYMAPEMFYKNIGGVSYKADVYSFGMLLMEIAGRRKNMNPFAEDVSQIYFPSWAFDQLCAGKEIDIEDDTEQDKKMIKKVITVALWCIQMKPSDRPSMNKVVEMLEGNSERQMPPKPFMAPREIASRRSWNN